VTQYERAIQNAFGKWPMRWPCAATVDEQLNAQQSLVNALAKPVGSPLPVLKGRDSYLSVLDAQRSLFAAQQVLVFLQLAKQAGDVNLRGLGGGWESEPPTRAAATASAPR